MSTKRSNRNDIWKPSTMAARAARVPSPSRDRPVPLLEVPAYIRHRGADGLQRRDERYPTMYVRDTEEPPGRLPVENNANVDGNDNNVHLNDEEIIPDWVDDDRMLEEVVVEAAASVNDEDNYEVEEVVQNGGGEGAVGELLVQDQPFDIDDMYDAFYARDHPAGLNAVFLGEFHHSDSDHLERFNQTRREQPEDLLLPDQRACSSLEVAQTVSALSRDLRFDLLRVLNNANVTRAVVNDLLTVLQGHVQSPLSKDSRGLWRTLPLSSLQCWLTRVCVPCQGKWQCKYEFGSREKIIFPSCDHEQFTYNHDYYVLGDVAEILALVLPSVWKWRKEEYLPPHMVDMMSRNWMVFDRDVTLTLSSDGVQVFTSSGLSVWGVMAYVDGIPYHIQRKSIFELGILCAREDNKTFQVNCLIEDVVKQVERLNRTGFKWIWQGQEITTRVLISRVVADTPARSSLQGLNMCRAAYGCNYCFQEAKSGYWPHRSRALVLRSDGNFRDVYASHEMNDASVRERYGIKFKSKFHKLPFDLVQGFPPDVMHCVYAGVAKLLLQQWTSKPPQVVDDVTKRRRMGERQPYQLDTRKINIVDARLARIAPPERTSRKPQELGKLGMWKAHELSMFVLYYGPVVLRGILPETYYDHYIQLVAGIASLSWCITEENLAEAQACLDRFSGGMKELYPDSCARYNVHLLRHLPHFCRRHGILPLFSMYMFETENHRLVNYVNGPVGFGLQMFRKSMTRTMLNSKEDAFDKDCSAQGCLEWELPRPDIRQPIRNGNFALQHGSFYAVYKPGGGRPRVVSKRYTLLKSRTSYIVMMTNGNVGIVDCYIAFRRSAQFMALVEEIRVSTHPGLPHIRYSAENLGFTVVPVTDFLEQVIEIGIAPGKSAYCMYLNNIEHVAE